MLFKDAGRLEALAAGLAVEGLGLPRVVGHVPVQAPLLVERQPTRVTIVRHCDQVWLHCRLMKYGLEKRFTCEC